MRHRAHPHALRCAPRAARVCAVCGSRGARADTVFHCAACEYTLCRACVASDALAAARVSLHDLAREEMRLVERLHGICVRRGILARRVRVLLAREDGAGQHGEDVREGGQREGKHSRRRSADVEDADAAVHVGDGRKKCPRKSRGSGAAEDAGAAAHVEQTRGKRPEGSGGAAAEAVEALYETSPQATEKLHKILATLSEWFPPRP